MNHGNWVRIDTSVSKVYSLVRFFLSQNFLRIEKCIATFFSDRNSGRNIRLIHLIIGHREIIYLR